MEEIDAHERTDAALKRAKEVAEAANFAKSRYVVGLSHELRTPLNTIMGYAQLLERDQAMTAKPRGQVAVMRRSANHLAGPDRRSSRHLEDRGGQARSVARRDVDQGPFLTQIVDMFCGPGRLARASTSPSRWRPTCRATVAMDEKRLRQILINLLSNAIKFTQSGTRRRCRIRLSQPGRRILPSRIPGPGSRPTISIASSSRSNACNRACSSRERGWA